MSLPSISSAQVPGRAASVVAIRGTGLGKSYRSGKVSTTVLRGLSVEIGRGELTLVSGPSGCGKSTLLSLLGGLLQPDAGRVQALDVDLWALAPRDLERFRLEHTGFVFQGFNLFAALSALEAGGSVSAGLHHALRMRYIHGSLALK